MRCEHDQAATVIQQNFRPTIPQHQQHVITPRLRRNLTFVETRRRQMASASLQHRPQQQQQPQQQQHLNFRSQLNKSTSGSTVQNQQPSQQSSHGQIPSTSSGLPSQNPSTISTAAGSRALHGPSLPQQLQQQPDRYRPHQFPSILFSPPHSQFDRGVHLPPTDVSYNSSQDGVVKRFRLTRQPTELTAAFRSLSDKKMSLPPTLFSDATKLRRERTKLTKENTSIQKWATVKHVNDQRKLISDAVEIQTNVVAEVQQKTATNTSVDCSKNDEHVQSGEVVTEINCWNESKKGTDNPQVMKEKSHLSQLEETGKQDPVQSSNSSALQTTAGSRKLLRRPSKKKKHLTLRRASDIIVNDVNMMDSDRKQPEMEVIDETVVLEMVDVRATPSTTNQQSSGVKQKLTSFGSVNTGGQPRFEQYAVPPSRKTTVEKLIDDDQPTQVKGHADEFTTATLEKECKSTANNNETEDSHHANEQTPGENPAQVSYYPLQLLSIIAGPENPFNLPAGVDNGIDVQISQLTISDRNDAPIAEMAELPLPKLMEYDTNNNEITDQSLRHQGEPLTIADKTVTSTAEKPNVATVQSNRAQAATRSAKSNRHQTVRQQQQQQPHTTSRFRPPITVTSRSQLIRCTTPVREKIKQFKQQHEHQRLQRLHRLRTNVPNAAIGTAPAARHGNTDVDDLNNELQHVRVPGQMDTDVNQVIPAAANETIGRKFSPTTSWHTWRDVNQSDVYRDVEKYIFENDLMPPDKEERILAWLEDGRVAMSEIISTERPDLGFNQSHHQDETDTRP